MRLFLLPKVGAYQRPPLLRLLLLDFEKYGVPYYVFSLETAEHIQMDGAKPKSDNWIPVDEIPARLLAGEQTKTVGSLTAEDERSP